jgi:hypothetical protein
VSLRQEWGESGWGSALVGKGVLPAVAILERKDSGRLPCQTPAGRSVRSKRDSYPLPYGRGAVVPITVIRSHPTAPRLASRENTAPLPLAILVAHLLLSARHSPTSSAPQQRSLQPAPRTRWCSSLHSLTRPSSSTPSSHRMRGSAASATPTGCSTGFRGPTPSPTTPSSLPTRAWEAPTTPAHCSRPSRPRPVLLQRGRCSARMEGARRGRTAVQATCTPSVSSRRRCARCSRQCLSEMLLPGTA